MIERPEHERTSTPATRATSSDESATANADASTNRRPLLHLPLIEAAEEASRERIAEKKPSWRGWIHAVTVPFAIALGIVLICLATTPLGKLSTSIFFTTSLLLFGISAVYHRFNWKPTTRAVLRRLDHANIFLLIAGTYTPLAMLTMPQPKWIMLLAIIWGGALLGIAFNVFWINAPRWLYVPLYLALGWAAMIDVSDIIRANAATAILVGIGGLAYTVGAVIYGTKRPNPVPGHFEFHEIFHGLTVIAFLCHWTAILLIAVNPPAFS